MDISIIIPSFNDSRIIRTVKSILSQNFPRDSYEIIIVDGGSPLDTFGVTLEYLKDECDVVICEKDEGIFDGLNKGVGLANGNLVFMIGSDDFLISAESTDGSGMDCEISLSSTNELDKSECS